MEKVAITGMGVVSSLGSTVDSYHRRLARGDVEVCHAPWAGDREHAWVSMIHDFEPLDWMEERVARGTDPFAQYAIAAAVKAVESSDIEPLDPLRTAVVIGTSMAGVETLTSSQHGFDTLGEEGVSRKLQIQAWLNMAAAQIALRWQLHGPLLTICTACASSLDAIGIAAQMMESGAIDVAIAGGCDRARSEITLVSAALYGMATAQPDPHKACRPFDRNRVGIMGGEGAGIVVLERADTASARGAEIHGRVRGYANVSDGFHPSSPEPTGKWEQLTMELALERAALPSTEVDALVAHGTGTPVGDSAEIRAINRVFQKRRAPLPVTSVKGHVGHTAGTAGVMNLIAGLEGMKHDQLVPVAGTTDLDPEIEFHVPLAGEPATVEIETLQVNSFGFGGQDASMVITRH